MPSVLEWGPNPERASHALPCNVWVVAGSAWKPRSSWVSHTCCRWAVVEPNKMGALYDGVHWDPPEGEAHVWWVPGRRVFPCTNPDPA